MADEKYIVELDLDAGTFEKKLKKASDAGEESGKKAGKSFKKEIEKGISAIDIGVAVAAFNLIVRAATRAAQSVANSFSSSIDAAVRQEDAVNRMNAALAMAGEFSEGTSRRMQDLASSIQDTTRFGDEAVLEMIALAQSMGVSSSNMESFIKAATELSAVTGKDLRASVVNLGKTMGGLTGELGEVLPQLKNLSPEALKAGAAIDFVNQRFGGAAQSQVRTFGGLMAQTANLVGDFTEAIGNLIIKSPVIQELFKIFVEGVVGATNSLKNFSQGGDFIGSVIVKILQFRGAVIDYIVRPLEYAYNFAKAFFLGMESIAQTFFTSLVDGAYRVIQFFAPESELAQSMTVFKQIATQNLDEVKLKAQEALNAMGDTGSAEQIGSVLDNIAARTEEALQRHTVATQGFKNNMKEMVDAAKITVTLTNQFLSQQLVGGISGAFQALGAALAQGQNGFEAFGRGVLAAMGDFAIKMGEMIITQAIAAEVLKDVLLTFGGFGIALAAGAALIAVGSAMKAFAGGPAGVGAAAGAAASPSAGGGGVNSGTTGGTEVATINEVAEREQLGTNVNVSVSGIVTNPRETAEQIAQLLKEGFETNNLNVGGAFV